MAHSHRKATREHRRRSAARGLVRLEVQAHRSDVDLIRGIADMLRREGAEAETARERLREILPAKPERSLADALASDLPDSDFESVFDRDPETRWRDINL